MGHHSLATVSLDYLLDWQQQNYLWSNKYNCQNITKKQIESVVHIVNDSCDGNVRVEHYKLKGSGHEWPNTINNISTPQIIWDFLSEFTKS